MCPYSFLCKLSKFLSLRWELNLQLSKLQVDALSIEMGLRW